jgi:hypothetical protein
VCERARSEYGAPVRTPDPHDEEEFPPRRPFADPSGSRAPEPAEDDEPALPPEPAPASVTGSGQAPIARS